MLKNVHIKKQIVLIYRLDVLLNRDFLYNVFDVILLYSFFTYKYLNLLIHLHIMTTSLSFTYM